MRGGLETQINKLLAQVDELDNCRAKLALLEEAVRLADACHDVERGFSIREDLVDVALDLGETEKAMVHFSWRLAQCDRDPERFSEDDLLWEYEWIVSSSPTFPEISREQIEAMLEDFARRSRRMGYGLRTFYKLRWDLALDMGDSAAASKWYRLWERAPRDDNTDCAACEQLDRVCYHRHCNRLERVVELARPILHGKLRCGSVLPFTLAWILVPLVRLGRMEEAAAAHLRGYRLIANKDGFGMALAQHLLFLALTDNLDRGLKLFENHFDPRFNFDRSARFLLERVRAGGRSRLKLRLPRTFAGYQPCGEYDVAALIEWLDQDCREDAALFDARNGNDWHQRQIEKARQWKKWVRPYPLRSKA